ncbi:MAG: DNA polymerase III subunit delta [Methyloligellaceae bacterium]
MVAISAGKVRQFIKAPDKNVRAILVYGPDIGQVRENSSLLAKALSIDTEDPGEIITIDDAESGASPDRLAVELQMVPMFGGSKVVRFRPAAKTNNNQIEELTKNTNLQAYLIVEGGDLKKSAKLRQIFEKSKNAVALPCYADDNRSLIQVIEEELVKENLSISSQARQHLANQLGADRGLSRTEIQKLLIYVNGKSTIEIEDIDAVIGDSSSLSLDAVFYATTGGRLAAALESLDKAIASGNAPSAILILLNRHIARFHKVRAELDRGDSLDFTIKRLRPPLHYKVQDEFKRQINRWSEKKLLIALDLIQQTTLRCRSKNAMELVFIERLLMSLSQMAGK